MQLCCSAPHGQQHSIRNITQSITMPGMHVQAVLLKYWICQNAQQTNNLHYNGVCPWFSSSFVCDKVWAQSWWTVGEVISLSRCSQFAVWYSSPCTTCEGAHAHTGVTKQGKQGIIIEGINTSCRRSRPSFQSMHGHELVSPNKRLEGRGGGGFNTHTCGACVCLLVGWFPRRLSNSRGLQLLLCTPDALLGEAGQKARQLCETVSAGGTSLWL